MHGSKDPGWWYAVAGTTLAVFVIAFGMSLTLWVTAADSSRAGTDQIVTAVGLFIGVASLLVSVVSVLQASRERAATDDRQDARHVMTDELIDLLRRAGGVSIHDVKTELRRNRSGLSAHARRSLNSVIRGKQSPTWDQVEAIVSACLVLARRRGVDLPADDKDISRWKSRYHELFRERRRTTGRWLVAGQIILAVLFAAPFLLFVPGGDEEAHPSYSPSAAQTLPGKPKEDGPGFADQEAPFTTSAVQVTDGCAWYLLSMPGAQVPPPPEGTADSWHAWAERIGAPIVGSTHVQFTVRGRSEAAVVLTDIKVKVLERKQPPKGIVVAPLCGGPDTFRWFDVDLDVDPPRITTEFLRSQADSNGPPQRREPLRFPYRVSLTDPETFDVFAKARKCDCVWQIELTWNSGERHGTQVVEVDGKPAQFRTIGTINAPTICFGSLANCEVRED